MVYDRRSENRRGEDRRSEDRHRVLKGGKVFFNNYAISADCMIRNESDHGMQIKMDPHISLPENISLLNRKDGTLAEARVIWKQAGSIGLQFKSPMQDVRTFAKSDIRRLSIIATRG